MSRGVKSNDSDGKRIYLTLMDGKFVQRVKEKTKTSRERALTKGDNEGKIVHEETFTEICGAFISAKVETSSNPKYGKSWDFVFDCSTEDEEIEVHFKVPYSSGYANNILFKLPNIDLSQDVSLNSYAFNDPDTKKRIVGVSVRQGVNFDYKVPNAYSKDEPNGLPNMEKVKVKGVDVWDDTKRLEFLEEMVSEKFGVLAITSSEETEFEGDELETEEEGDAPF
jgi:hypothetical protein